MCLRHQVLYDKLNYVYVCLLKQPIIFSSLSYVQLKITFVNLRAFNVNTLCKFKRIKKCMINSSEVIAHR